MPNVASYGTSGSLPDMCGFCGRWLHDTDRYVRGPRTAMCDRCLTTAVGLFALRAEPHIVIPLADVAADADDRADHEAPPPDDAAVAEITTAISAVFGDFHNEANVREFFEDVSQHDALLSFEPIPYVAQANVGEIRFVDVDTAEVEFEVTLGGSPFGRFRGLVRRRDGRWVVTAETVPMVYIGLRLSQDDDGPAYDSPEDAALASWSSTLAETAILTVTKDNRNTATVTISIAAPVPMQFDCDRSTDGSWETHGWSSST